MYSLSDPVLCVGLVRSVLGFTPDERLLINGTVVVIALRYFVSYVIEDPSSAGSSAGRG